MNKSRIIIMWMGLWVCLPLSVWAQVPPVTPGDTVRVTYAAITTTRVVGILQDISGDRLYLAKEDSTLSFARSSIRKMDVSVGRRTWEGRGAAIGAVTGGLIMGVIAMASDGGGDSSTEPDPWGFDEIDLFSPGVSFVLGFVVGAAGGALAGLVIGGLTETPRWEKVPLDVAVEPISFRYENKHTNYGLTLKWSFK